MFSPLCCHSLSPVPQQGRLEIQTECGWLEVFPGEICVIPRGFLMCVKLPDGPSRGYICEVFDNYFRLPNLGPIGANGLANPRDFKYPGLSSIFHYFPSHLPVAAYEDRKCDYTVVAKFIGELFEYKRDHSPFNVRYLLPHSLLF